LENLTLAGDEPLNGIGNSADNVITGNSAENTLDGQGGNNQLLGGLGNDGYIVRSVNDTVIETPDAGLDTVLSFISYSLPEQVENLTLQGDQAINGTGNNLDNVIIGNVAHNTLDGGEGRDWLYSQGDIDFTASEGTLTGLDTDTFTNIETLRLIGGAGDNTFDASALITTRVVLTGRNGDDTFKGGSASNDVVRETGNVNFTATEGTLTGRGTDTFTNIETLRLIGGAGDNTFDASALITTRVVLTGGHGDDTFKGGSASNDVIQETADIDFTATEGTLTGMGTDTFTNIETLRLTGGASDNTFDASALTSTRVRLTGEDGDDILLGGGGRDFLEGGLGSDILTGGTGNDRLTLGVDTVTDTVNYSSGDGIDNVFDFVRGEGRDVLNFSGFTHIDVRTVGTNTQFRVSDGILDNADFGKGTLLLTTRATTGFTANDVNVNLVGADFLFS